MRNNDLKKINRPKFDYDIGPNFLFEILSSRFIFKITFILNCIRFYIYYKQC